MQMTSRGDKTYVSFIANSGGLGSDVRSRITAELDKSGAIENAFFGGGGLTMLGDRLIAASGGIMATNTMTSACLGSRVFKNQALEPRGVVTVPTNVIPDVFAY